MNSGTKAALIATASLPGVPGVLFAGTGLSGLGATTTLPSVEAAEALWTNRPNAPRLIAISMLERAAIVAPTLWLVGERKPGPLALKTLAVVGAIELVVLWQIRRQLAVGA